VAKSLPASQYEAVWLKYAEGMSVKQIARVMNKSQVHVKVLLHRGRVRMSKRLKRTAGEDSVRDAEAARENYHIPESAGV
jgi:DNA-directed RNA polymerase specialized sigma24 family protein